MINIRRVAWYEAEKVWGHQSLQDLVRWGRSLDFTPSLVDLINTDILFYLTLPFRHHSCYILISPFPILYFPPQNKLNPLWISNLWFSWKEMKTDKIFKLLWPLQYCLDFKGPDNKGCFSPKQKTDLLQDNVSQVQMTGRNCRNLLTSACLKYTVYLRYIYAFLLK